MNLNNLQAVMEASLLGIQCYVCNQPNCVRVASVTMPRKYNTLFGLPSNRSRTVILGFCSACTDTRMTDEFLKQVIQRTLRTSAHTKLTPVCELSTGIDGEPDRVSLLL